MEKNSRSNVTDYESINKGLKVLLFSNSTTFVRFSLLVVICFPFTFYFVSDFIIILFL